MKKNLLKTVSVAALSMTAMTMAPVDANAAWKQNSTGWWFTEGNSWATGWRQISGAWYYFDANGYMKTGWVKDGASWYYLDNSGAMKTGWVQDKGTWYYMNNSGSMQIGWVKDGFSWYYMNSSGAMQTGWIKDGSSWYYLNNNGSMLANSWVTDGINDCYVGPSGAMVTGFYTVPYGKTYYFYESGYKAINTIINGYLIDENGVVNSKANVNFTDSDAIKIVKNEDSKFIDDFITRNTADGTRLSVGSISRFELMLSGYNFEKEFFYSIELYNSNGPDSFTNEGYRYYVGATTGKLYCYQLSGLSNKIYEIKDNTIVNGFNDSNDPYRNTDWR